MSKQQDTGSRRAFALWRLVLAAGIMLAVSVGMVSAASAAKLTLTPEFSSFNHLGEGTTVTAELNLEGSEYFGYASPLKEFRIHLPAGTGVSGAGFPTCERATIEERGAESCPPGSFDGPPSESIMVVAFGTELRAENVKVQTVFGPGGVLNFYLYGRSPVSVEFAFEGRYSPDSSPYGQELKVELPEVETVPGAAHGIVTKLALNFGASLEENGVDLHSVTMPDECPSGQFAWAAEAVFYGNTNGASAEAKTACPAAGSRQPTTTTLTASTTTPLLGESVTYTATVTPTTANGAEPSGKVTFLDESQPINGCDSVQLTVGSSSSTAICQLRYAAYVERHVTAAYVGDPNYLGSTSESVPVTLSKAYEEGVKQHELEAKSGGSTPGGGTPPGGGTTNPGNAKISTSTEPPAKAVKCTVPKLKGKTLAQAKKGLEKAHCKLGKVTKSKGHAKHTVVVSQKPGPSSKTLPAGTKIAVKLS